MRQIGKHAHEFFRWLLAQKESYWFCVVRSILGLPQIVRTAWYRPMQLKDLDSHLIRTLLAARAGLVAMHRDVAHQIRGVLKTFGWVAGMDVVLGEQQPQVPATAVAQDALTKRSKLRQLVASNPLLVEVYPFRPNLT